MRPAEGLTAVVLAGGDASDGLAALAGVPAKALLPVAGRPLAGYVLDALRASGLVRETVYVGPTDQELADYDVVPVPAGQRFEDSLALGLGAALGRGADQLLVATADLPWLTADDVSRFVHGALGLHADLVYPIVAQEHMVSAFPEQRRTYVRLREGRFTGGNLALLSPQAVTSLLPIVSKAFGVRKNPVRMAGLIGLDVIVSLVAGTASLAPLETRVSRILGLQARALRMEDAGVAADVDRIDHLPGMLDPVQPEWRKA